MHETRSPTEYVGRFAPSPTGDLHFGSLVAAVASYLRARQAGGRWLIRIEDIDPPREVPGSARRILRDLERLGMVPDAPVLYQSTRTGAYEAAWHRLVDEGKAYWCGCSRKELLPSGAYPGTCRNGITRDKAPRAVRLRVDGSPTRFDDLLQGAVEEQLEHSVGDFVIRRADGQAAYQLAVVLDDHFQGISEVVRGSDLLDSTTRQIRVQQSLGLPTPAYVHIPVAIQADGHKLSKRFESDPVGNLPPREAIRMALGFLGHSPPAGLDLDGLWAWAFEHWRVDRVPRAREMRFLPAGSDCGG